MYRFMVVPFGAEIGGASSNNRYKGPAVPRWRVPDGAGIAQCAGSRNGESGALDTRRGLAGDLEVRAPATGVVELAYGPGVPELAGLAVTALGILLWLVGPRYFTAAAPASEHS